MVCAKCQKLQKKTELVTPGVKRKNEMYYGSLASSATSAGNKSKTSATAGVAGIGKVETMLYPMIESETDPLFSSCSEQAPQQKRKESLRGLFQFLRHLQNENRPREEILSQLRIQGEWLVKNQTSLERNLLLLELIKVPACAMCGKSQSKEASTGKALIVQGQRFSAK